LAAPAIGGQSLAQREALAIFRWRADGLGFGPGRFVRLLKVESLIGGRAVMATQEPAINLESKERECNPRTTTNVTQRLPLLHSHRLLAPSSAACPFHAAAIQRWAHAKRNTNRF